MGSRWVGLLLILGVLSACATLPTGPSVLVLPGVGKPFDQFQIDDAVCRQFAQQQVGLAPGQVATQQTVTGVAVGAAIGAGVGAAIGAAAGNAGTGAAVGAGSGLLLGTAAGTQGGAVSAQGAQWRYDVVYIQCMYAKGNQVPGVASASQPLYVPPPPPGSALPVPPPPSAPPR
ncbi:MAG: glycine zipper family protein [Nitrospinae bacterium]|nr:glycine zipper family protein [Nitrospinota bacterium]